LVEALNPSQTISDVLLFSALTDETSFSGKKLKKLVKQRKL